jgi:hypothetical protein
VIRKSSIFAEGIAILSPLKLLPSYIHILVPLSYHIREWYQKWKLKVKVIKTKGGLLVC